MDMEIPLDIRSYIVRLLDSTETSTKLIKLMKTHEYMSFAVAWASFNNKVFENIRKKRIKVKNGVIGTHFHQTDSRVLEWTLNRNSNMRFVFDSKPNSVFHPKIYVLWSKERWDIFVGSPNLTIGGMENNTELTLHLSGKKRKSRDVMDQALEKIAGYWKLAVRVDQRMVNRYKREREERERKKDSNQQSGNDEILSLNWDEYCSKICSRSNSSKERIKMRVKLLKMARDVFEKDRPFNSLGEADRKALAGTYRFNSGKWSNIDIGYFGSTNAYGYYVQLVNSNDRHLSEAIGCIPSRGTVSREDYLNYIDLFRHALEGKKHGLGVAARLLTIKRPDVFISWNGGNKQQLKALLGVKPMIAPTEYERFWDEVIAPVNESLWCQGAKPSERKQRHGIKETDIWQNRVALLDVLCWG